LTAPPPADTAAGAGAAAADDDDDEDLDGVGWTTVPKMPFKGARGAADDNVD